MKSIDKFERLIQSVKNDTQFAKSIGISKNALYKYRNGKKYHEKELRTDIAIEISKVYKIDFYYFYNDDIEISDNPSKTYPVVDSCRVNELEGSVKALVSQVSELIKKGQKTNSKSLKMISEFADDAIKEFISATIKIENFSKAYLASNTDLAIIVKNCTSGLVFYANRKAKDFAQLTKILDSSDMSNIIDVLKEINEFKVENATYILQINEVLLIIEKNRIIERYSELYCKQMEAFDLLDEKLNHLYDIYGDDEEELDNMVVPFINCTHDLESLLSLSKALLIRDLSLGFDVKEVRDGLMPCIKPLFYDNKGEFELHSNPQTLENISKAFIDYISGKDYIKNIYNKFLDAFNQLKLSIEEYEKNKESDIQC